MRAQVISLKKQLSTTRTGGRIVVDDRLPPLSAAGNVLSRLTEEQYKERLERDRLRKRRR